VLIYKAIMTLAEGLLFVFFGDPAIHSEKMVCTAFPTGDRPFIMGAWDWRAKW